MCNRKALTESFKGLEASRAILIALTRFKILPFSKKNTNFIMSHAQFVTVTKECLTLFLPTFACWAITDSHWLLAPSLGDMERCLYSLQGT